MTTPNPDQAFLVNAHLRAAEDSLRAIRKKHREYPAWALNEFATVQRHVTAAHDLITPPPPAQQPPASPS